MKRVDRFLQTVAALAVLACAACPAAAADLLQAGVSPTLASCAAISRYNSEQLSAVQERHSTCLDNSPNVAANEYQRANPCSKLACLDLHRQMDWIRQQNALIDKDCRSRVQEPSQTVIDGSGGSPVFNDTAASGPDSARKQAFLRMDQLRDLGKSMYEAATAMDRPWLFAQRSGKIAIDEYKAELKRKNGHAPTEDELNWGIYQSFFKHGKDQLTSLPGQNPVASAVNKEMLTQLHFIIDDLHEVMNNTTAQMAEVGAMLPEPTAAMGNRRVSYPASSSTRTAGANRSAQADDAGCAILGDMSRSSALLAADSAAWLALNDRCGKQKPE